MKVLPHCIACRRMILAIAGLLSAPALFATDLYWRTDGTTGQTWTGLNWSNPASGTGGTGWTDQANSIFTANSNLTFATTDIGNVTVAENVTVTVANGGTLGTNGAVRTFDIGSGATLTWTSQSITTADGEQGMGFIKNGAGTWEMGAWGTSSSSNTGPFTLNAGTVSVTGGYSLGRNTTYVNGGAIQSSGSVTFQTETLSVGGDFTLSGTGNDTWSAAVDLNGGVRILTQNASGNRTFSGQISNGALTKTGSGTLTLAGNNSYSGATTISTGTLSLGSTGSIATSSEIAIASGATLDVSGLSGWTVAAGQKLSGAGTVAGNVTVHGTHAVSGAQTVTGNLAYGGSSVFEWSLSEASVTTGFDQVTVSGALGSAAGAFRVLTDLDFSTSFWQQNQNWETIFNVAGSVSGWAANTPVAVYTTANVLRNNISNYGSFTISGSKLSWNHNPNYTPIPEPTTALAGLLLAAGLLRRRR